MGNLGRDKLTERAGGVKIANINFNYATNGVQISFKIANINFNYLLFFFTTIGEIIESIETELMVILLDSQARSSPSLRACTQVSRAIWRISPRAAELRNR